MQDEYFIVTRFIPHDRLSMRECHGADDTVEALIRIVLKPCETTQSVQVRNYGNRGIIFRIST